jgi:isoleucyl-tRNA synthetase
VAGEEHELDAEDLLVSMKPLEGYQVEREGSHAVALELEVDDELRVEGWAREIVHAIQAARRDAGLEVTDRIALTLGGDQPLVRAAQAHQDYIAGETLAVQVSYESSPDGSHAAQISEAGGRAGGECDGAEPVTIDGLRLQVWVALAT